MTGVSSLQLVYHIDGDGGNVIASMDLLNFAQGFELSEGGWIPQVAQGGETTLIETLNFRVYGLSQDAIAARLQVLDDWITRVNYYRNSTMRTAVWLRVRVKGETEYRQALIWTLRYSVGASPFGTMWADNKLIPDVSISIERAALWEEITPQSEILESAIGNYTLDVLSAVTSGDAPARVWTIQFNATAASRQNTAYFGFKNDRYFSPSLFQPTRPLTAYEAGAGTDAAFVDDATAISGRIMTVDFATAETLTQRHLLPVKYLAEWDGINITRSTLTNDYVRGNYLVLMRALAFEDASPPIIRARIKVGYSGSTGDYIYPRVSITSPDWHLYEMGVIQLPQDRSSAYNSTLDTAIKIDAELVDGSGSLYIDSYILIPVDGAVKVYSDDGFISGAGGTNRDGLVETNPLYESYGYTISSTPTIYDTAIVSPFDWLLPHSQSVPNIIVCALDDDDTDSLVTTTWDATVKYLRRWRTLRGAE